MTEAEEHNDSDSGVDWLNQLLEEVYQFIDSHDLNAAKNVLGSKNSTIEDIAQSVPDSILNFYMNFIYKQDVEFLSNIGISESQRILDCRAYLIKNIPELMSNYVLSEKASEIAKDKEDLRLLERAYNMVNSININSAWSFDGSSFRAYARIILSDKQNNVLFDTTMNSENLAPIAVGLVEGMRDELSNSLRLHEKGESVDNIENMIKKYDRNIDKIKSDIDCIESLLKDRRKNE